MILPRKEFGNTCLVLEEVGLVGERWFVNT
jgi:hypothetical protein